LEHLQHSLLLLLVEVEYLKTMKNRKNRTDLSAVSESYCCCCCYSQEESEEQQRRLDCFLLPMQAMLLTANAVDQEKKTLRSPKHYREEEFETMTRLFLEQTECLLEEHWK